MPEPVEDGKGVKGLMYSADELEYVVIRDDLLLQMYTKNEGVYELKIDKVIGVDKDAHLYIKAPDED